MIQPSNSVRNSSKEAALAFHARLFINQSAVQLGAPADAFAFRLLLGSSSSARGKNAAELGRWS
ncbi:hypothetical protein [Hydrocarboniphaga sp.]|uniref:hypothetical protein n=1 Tax=Hydrocarboniphaga sp. TaxID=2033016 RepID=UPI00260C2551|nr:hypothetical protein [Hydrocarboniphaga sp.]